MNNQFAKNLKKIRKDNNLSQEQLAEELGVSRQAISKWESSIAYPEMDKIIALSNKFNLNIDDLLHNDIREIKGEEENKKTLNKAIEDFLNFITNTINLFINMNFKSKIKCLLEQIMIIGILIFISAIIVYIGHTLFFNIFSFLPHNISYFLNNFLNSLLIIFCIIASIIIIVHVFKTRYLDYYDKLKQNINSKENVYQEEKIVLNKKENKIIIRDPKHSEYKFINSLFKFIIGIIKFFALWLVLFLCFILIILLASFILTFLIAKTGLFFLGLLIAILAATGLTIIILLIILNFIASRSNAKKKMIISFISLVIALGVGCGLTFIGTLNFEVLDVNETMLKTQTIELAMQDNLFLNDFHQNVKYVEKDIKSLKIEVQMNKYCQVKNLEYHQEITLITNCSKPFKLAKEVIKNLNNKKIVPLSSEIQEIIIYASSENINKLKTNASNYYQKQQDYEEQVYNYENKIQEYEDKIYELNEQIA